ncbi:MAG: PAS domain S-box protein [Leptospirales bacterium]
MSVGNSYFLVLVENSKDLIYRYRLSKPIGFEYVSPSAKKITGYTPKEYYDDSEIWRKLQHPDDLSFLDSIEQIPPEGKVETLRWIHKDGTDFWIEQHNVPVYDQNGSLIAIEGIIRNISEQKQTEQSLKNSENRYRAIADYTYDWESWHASDGKLIWVNSGVTRLTGYNEKECYSMENYPLELTDEEDHKIIRQYQLDASKEKTGNDVEFRVICKDGSTCWAAISWQPIYDTDGSSMGYRSSVRDITERKRAERSVVSLGRIIEDSLNEIYIFDAGTYKFVHVNRGAQKNLGYSMSDLKKMTPLDIKPEYNINTFNELIEPLRTGKLDKIIFTTIHKRKDNSVYNVEVHLQLTKYKMQDVFIAIILDITERLSSEKQLKYAQKTLQTLLDNSPDFIYFKDVHRKFVRVSKSFSKLFHRPVEEVIGKQDEDLFPPEITKYSIPDDKQVIEKGVRVINRVEGGEPVGGEKPWVSTTKVPWVDDQGKVMGLFGISRDVTASKMVELALKESEERFRKAFNHSKVGMKILDMHYKYTMVNPAFCEMTGYSEEELLGMKFGDLIHPDDVEGNSVLLKRLMANEIDYYHVEKRYKKKEGTDIWVDLTVSTSGKEEGSITNIIAIVQDITIRKMVEDIVKLSATVFDNSTQAMMITDNVNQIISVNPAFTRVTGYSEKEVIGKDPGLLKSGRQGQLFYEEFWASLNTTGHWEGEIWNRRKNGEIYPEQLLINTVKKEDGTVNRVAQFSDITNEKAAEERIRKMATTDALTRVANRYLFNHQLQDAVSLATRLDNKFAIFIIDIDNFKKINDTHGHPVGDAVLKHIADILQKESRATDTVARLGGDEFAIIYTLLENPKDVQRTAKQILRKTTSPFQISNTKIEASVSIGISVFPDNGTSIEELLRKADKALYSVKQTGRGNFSVYNDNRENNK